MQVEKQSKMVPTSDHWYPNFSSNRVLATIQHSQHHPEHILISIRGEGDFGLKTYFPVSAANEAQQTYDTILLSDPRIDECLKQGFYNYKLKVLKVHGESSVKSKTDEDNKPPATLWGKLASVFK